jgi:hypothetical protein
MLPNEGAAVVGTRLGTAISLTPARCMRDRQDRSGRRGWMDPHRSPIPSPLPNLFFVFISRAPSRLFPPTIDPHTARPAAVTRFTLRTALRSGRRIPAIHHLSLFDAHYCTGPSLLRPVLPSFTGHLFGSSTQCGPDTDPMPVADTLLTTIRIVCCRSGERA